MNQTEGKRRQTECISAVLAFVTLTFFARMTGQNGIAYFAAAFEIVWLGGLLISGAASDTIGRLVRIRSSKGQYRNVSKLKGSVLALQAALSLAGTMLLLGIAEPVMGGAFRLRYGSLILLVLAPSLFFRTVSDVLIGYFRGEGTELPAAVSSILRQAFIFGFGMLFGRILKNYGAKVSRLLLQDNFTAMYAGVGIAVAVTLTELFIVVFLFLIYKGRKRPRAKMQEDGMRFTDSAFDSIRSFVVGRGVPAGIRLLAFLPFPVGLLFLQKAMQGTDEAAVQYGAYTACYAVVCGILLSLLFLPASQAGMKLVYFLRKEEQRYVKNFFQNSVHMIAARGFFAVAAITVLSSQLAASLTGGEDKTASSMLAGGASVILFVLLAVFFARYLTASGRKLLVLGSFAVADVVYVISATVFLNVGQMKATALVFAGELCAAVLCVLLGFLSYRQLRCRLDWLRVFAVPALAACVSAVLMLLLAKLLTPHLGNAVTALLTAVIGLLVYWCGLLLLRNLSEQETEDVPGGKLIGWLGRLLRIF